MTPAEQAIRANTALTKATARRPTEAMSPWTLGIALPNFVAEDDPAARLRASYGDANYARLVRVKAAYDPDGLFRMPQGIAVV